MAKGKDDIILRDRMQFNVTNAGVSTVYGRLDLSDYVNAIEKQGLNIKEVLIQPRFPVSGEDEGPFDLINTGIWSPIGVGDIDSIGNPTVSALKVWATTRAYESAGDVGIASPDVLMVEEWIVTTQASGVDMGSNHTLQHVRYGPLDLHPEGYVVVSDLLIGIAADNLLLYDNTTIELDVMLIAEHVKVTAKELTNMLTQAQDL